jgi:hypothetical protein
MIKLQDLAEEIGLEETNKNTLATRRYNKKNPGKLMIRDGFHRFAAMMALGWKKVPIHIM